jgi:hypothetical protein
MPQKDMSSRIGRSSSPVIQKVISNNTNVQRSLSVPSCVKSSYNKQPVKVPVKK